MFYYKEYLIYSKNNIGCIIHIQKSIKGLCNNNFTDYLFDTFIFLNKVTREFPTHDLRQISSFHKVVLCVGTLFSKEYNNIMR